ncbi:MAG: arsenate reductase (glutaredoxin) [Flavobacteriales bacterium]|nr:arsenate reductase (glutaredoxin) [Flavobacteriales bacterium]
MKIYHNNRCRKSREALEILKKHKSPVTCVEYLKNPPSVQELRQIIKMLNISAVDLVRKSEKLYKEKFKNHEYTENEWLDILSSNPILIQRPIIIKDNRAILGRPPINVLDLLDI